MAKRTFHTQEQYLHFPICCGLPEEGNYVEVYADGVFKDEIFLQIAPPHTPIDFYAGFYIGKYHAEEITLVCNDETEPSNLFGGVLTGGRIQEEKNLYPYLYKEPTRQQIHFSPARGWMNDPNGLFYKDGIFHFYFQHNPLANHHFNSIVSWGHATSTDGVHFVEHHDAITPRGSKHLVASGSAIVDTYNVSGLGENTILAAYTDLNNYQYRGRERTYENCGQCVMVSTDGGMHFQDVRKGVNPLVPAQIGARGAWRDPKLLFLEDGTLCMGVYENFENRDCISFYCSRDCLHWELRSRCMDMYECPDLFPLQSQTGEMRWVLYGGNGKYRVGKFENFTFTQESEEGWLDFGSAVYAGQTFNNYDNPCQRLHVAWMKDNHQVCCASIEPSRKQPFSQSASLICALTLHKTPFGWRLHRNPREQLQALRKGDCTTHTLEQPLPLCAPCEIRFSLQDTGSVHIFEYGFTWDKESGLLTSTSGKSILLTKQESLSVIAYADRRSIEFFVGEQVSLTFSIDCDSHPLLVKGKASHARVWQLKSIWND